MAGTQTSAQLLKELAKLQQDYKTVSRRIEGKLGSHQADARGPKYTADQIAYRAEMLKHILEPMYGELHYLGARVEKMKREAADLEAAETLLSLKG